MIDKGKFFIYEFGKSLGLRESHCELAWGGWLTQQWCQLLFFPWKIALKKHIRSQRISSCEDSLGKESEAVELWLYPNALLSGSEEVNDLASKRSVAMTLSWHSLQSQRSKKI
jgi:hypothetical protein